MRLIDADAFSEQYGSYYTEQGTAEEFIGTVGELIAEQPTIEAEPVRHGRWIECDYKHIEHGMIEIVTNGGLFCSECGTAFQKKKMTYKQFCAACGAKMDGGADNG